MPDVIGNVKRDCAVENLQSYIGLIIFHMGEKSRVICERSAEDCIELV